VRIVTGGTPIVLNDGMKGTVFGRIVVTLDAKIRAGGNEKFRVLRRVGIVTVYTTAIGSCFVHNGL